MTKTPAKAKRRVQRKTDLWVPTIREAYEAETEILQELRDASLEVAVVSESSRVRQAAIRQVESVERRLLQLGVATTAWCQEMLSRARARAMEMRKRCSVCYRHGAPDDCEKVGTFCHRCGSAEELT